MNFNPNEVGFGGFPILKKIDLSSCVDFEDFPVFSDLVYLETPEYLRILMPAWEDDTFGSNMTALHSRLETFSGRSKINISLVVPLDKFISYHDNYSFEDIQGVNVVIAPISSDD